MAIHLVRYVDVAMLYVADYLQVRYRLPTPAASATIQHVLPHDSTCKLCAVGCGLGKSAEGAGGELGSGVAVHRRAGCRCVKLLQYSCNTYDGDSARSYLGSNEHSTKLGTESQSVEVIEVYHAQPLPR
jgi:hypothetical protein